MRCVKSGGLPPLLLMKGTHRSGQSRKGSGVVSGVVFLEARYLELFLPE